MPTIPASIALTESPYFVVCYCTGQDSLTENPHGLISMLVSVCDQSRLHNPTESRLPFPVPVTPLFVSAWEVPSRWIPSILSAHIAFRCPSHIGHAWHVLCQPAIGHDSHFGPALAPLKITTIVGYAKAPRQDAKKTLELNPKMFEVRVVLGWAVGDAQVRAAWVRTHHRAPMTLPLPKP